MNRREAQEILQLYRPDTADRLDPAFAEALQLAAENSELKTWFENHCANYGILRERFKQIAVPGGLREQILAEQKTSRKIISPFRFLERPTVFAIAAVIVLLLGLALMLFPLRTNDGYKSYRNRMVSTALRVYRMDLETNDLTQVRAFLARRNAPSTYELPPPLQKLECTGCVVVRWQNKPVSMICFRTGRELPPGETSDLFLFVTDDTVFPNASLEASPAVEKINQVAIARWSQDHKFYLLTTRGTEEFIRKFL